MTVYAYTRIKYGKKKGEKVFYASQNKGTIKGTHKKRKSPRRNYESRWQIKY